MSSVLPVDGRRPIKEGWAKKLGKVIRNWKTRYFALTSSSLMYFTNQEKRKLKGSIPRENVVDVLPVDQKGSHVNVVIVFTNEIMNFRQFFISFNTKGLQEEWTLALQKWAGFLNRKSGEASASGQASSVTPARNGSQSTEPGGGNSPSVKQQQQGGQSSTSASSSPTMSDRQRALLKVVQLFQVINVMYSIQDVERACSETDSERGGVGPGAAMSLEFKPIMEALLSLFTHPDRVTPNLWKESRAAAAEVLVSTATIHWSTFQDMVHQKRAMSSLVHLMEFVEDATALSSFLDLLLLCSSADALHPNNQRSFRECGGFELLVPLLGHPSEEIRGKSAFLVNKQCYKCSENKDRFRDCSGLEPLVALLCHGINRAEYLVGVTSSLRTLTFDNAPNVEILPSLGVFPLLAPLLKHEDPNVSIYTVMTINNLTAHNDANKTTVMELNCVPSVVNLIAHPNSVVSKSAITCTYNLSEGRSDILMQVARAGAGAKLIAALDTQDEDLSRANILGLLGNMIEGGFLNLRSFGDAGGIKKVQSMLGQGRNSCLTSLALDFFWKICGPEQEPSVWVLKYLVQELDWQKITHAILSVGPVRDFSCMVLPRVIAARLPSEEFPSTIIRTALLALRDDEDQEGTVSCAACVLVKSILDISTEIRDMSITEELSHVMVQCLTSPHQPIRAMAVILFLQFAKSIPAMLLFVKSQAIPALIQLLQVEDAITTENAAFALALVCRDVEYPHSSMVRQLNGIPALVELLSHPTNPPSRVFACNALVCISHPEGVDAQQNCEAVRQAGTITRVASLLSDPFPDACRMAAFGIRVFGEYPPMLEEMKDRLVTNRLVTLLQSSSRPCRWEAIGGLLFLTERDELFLDQLEEEPQSLRVIVDLLNGSQEDLEMLYSAILLLLRLKNKAPVRAMLPNNWRDRLAFLQAETVDLDQVQDACAWMQDAFGP